MILIKVSRNPNSAYISDLLTSGCGGVIQRRIGHLQGLHNDVEKGFVFN